MASTSLFKDILDFDPGIFLASSGEGWKVATFLKRQTIFAQGDAAGSVYYIQNGRVRHTVVSKFGKKATLGILIEGAFFGDSSLAGQPLRLTSATAMTDCKLLQIDKKAMLLALHREPTFRESFVAYLLARNIGYQEDLMDQLFGSGEKRLAQVLLMQAHFSEKGTPETVIPKLSQKTLADMAGITRLRASFFMNKFKKSGFLDHGRSGMRIRSSLLKVVLRDD